MKTLSELRRWTIALSVAALLSITLTQRVAAQDQPEQDDPPTRVARLGYVQGAVSFQPAGESDWVDAVPNRPMTTGDQLWADKDSRAELQLGSALIDVNSNTGVSFLNLDDRTVQLQLSSGSINIRVRRLNRDDVFEIDTPDQAFTIFEAGRYRVEASADGTYSVVSVREGEGEATGNGQTYTVRAGQRATFDGTDTLNAQVEDLGGPDEFDNWSYSRYRHYEDSPSGRYVSRDVVGYEDLDNNGDWRPAMNYGNVWFPHVQAGWAPYRDGHWAWIDPWGWTWVDEEPWGYAPFHYGRWVSVEGRWGWVPGPMEIAPVYAPALVVFVGGGPGGFGGNIGWFPLGPREVFVPSYRVSRGYVNRVNISNTTVNVTTVTNVYNTTIVHNNTNITNVTYVNRNVSGAVTAVPQRNFASAQPVSRSVVRMNEKEVASMRVSSRAEVVPTSNSVLGARANTANRAVAPPAAVARRAVVAKKTPPPAPVPFAARQKALESHPGQPIERQQMQQLRPAAAAAARPQVKQAPPGKPATATPKAAGNAPANRPGNAPAANQPGNRPGNVPAANQPGNRPAENQPANRPGNAPGANQPANRPGNAPAANQPPNRPGNPPASNERPGANAPAPKNQPGNRPAEPPARSDRPPSAQPANRPAPNQPAQNQRPEATRPQPNQPAQSNRPSEPPARNERPAAQPPQRNEPAARPAQPPQRNEPAARPAQPPQRNEPAARPAQPPQRNEPAARPAQPPQRNEPAVRPAQPPQRNEPAARPAQPPHQPTPAEKKQQEDKKKRDEKPPGY